MSRLAGLLRKMSILIGRERFRSELDEEMQFHREQTERALIDGGMPSEEAYYAAMRQFGNAAKQRDRGHEVVRFSLETVVQDLRFALRQLRRHPGFAATAISILALGMGVSVAIFGFVDAALLQPLPYADPGRLLSVDESSVAFPRSNLSYEDYVDWKRMNRTLSSFDVYTGTGYLLRTSSGTEPVVGGRVSDGFFRTLGVRPLLGRDFYAGEDQPGKQNTLIITYGAWRNRFGARRDVIGQTVDLSGETYTIVGVLPREFSFAPRGNAEFWAPLHTLTGCEKRRGCHNLDGVGRLHDGVTVQAARADFTTIAKQLEQQYPGTNRDQGASIEPLSEIIVGRVRPILLTLLGGAGLLLLIACINVASLLLVRSESRRREIAVRGALGATPRRLVRQFVTEGLLMAVAGALGGVAVAVWIMSLLTRLVPKGMVGDLPFLAGVRLNAHTGAFASAVAALAALLLAATPALRLSFQQVRDGFRRGRPRSRKYALAPLWRESCCR